MEYTTLGDTGMQVSRICLGCAGFGTGGSGRWTGRSPGDHRARHRPRRELLRHRERLLERGVRAHPRGRARGLRPRRAGRRDQVFGDMNPDDPNASGGVPEGPRAGARRLPGAAGDGRRWTSTRPTAGITRRPSSRRWRRSTTPSAGEGAVHQDVLAVGAPVRRSAAHQRPAGLRALRHDAEPLQSRLPRGKARDATVV